MTLLNKLPQGGGGWIELVDCSGAFAGYQDIVSANLRLTNGAKGYALKVTTGTNGTFSGKIAGTGTIIIQNTDGNNEQNNCEFTGDISGWNGLFSFVQTSCNSFNLKLNGTSNINTDINVSGDNNNTLNVIIGGGSGTRNISSHIYREGSGNHSINLSLSGNSVKSFTAASDVEVNDMTTANGATTVNGKLTVLGTLTAGSAVTVNGTFVGGEGFVKAGSADVTLSSNASLSKTKISAGTLKVISQWGGINFGEIMLNGGTFSMYNGQNISAYHTISKLTVQNADSVLRGDNHHVCVNIQGLAFDGVNTLKVQDHHTIQHVSVYQFSGETTFSEGLDGGTIDFSQQNSGTKRNTAISLAGLNTLEKVVVNYSAAVSTTGQTDVANKARNVVVVSADEVRLAGLDSANTISDYLYLASHGTASAACNSTSAAVSTDGVTRTLTFTGDGENTHTFYGIVLDSLNIVMGDANTNAAAKQVFAGNTTAFNGNITVNKGTLTFNNSIGTSSAITVAAGSTLSLAGGTVADLDVGGTLKLTAGTLAVTNILALDQALNISTDATLDLTNISLIDLTGLSYTESNGSLLFDLLAGETRGTISGLTEGQTIDLTKLRVNGIGWTEATYVGNGVISLSRGEDAQMLEWRTAYVEGDEATLWTQGDGGTTFYPSGSDAATAISSESSNVTFTVDAKMQLGCAIELAGLDVDTGKSLTLTGGNSLSVSYINLEKNAMLDAGAVTLKADNIDLSSGSILTLGTVSGITDGTHPVYTGTGTVKVSFGADPGTVSMAEASVFVGTVNVTGGTVDLSGSAISQGTWKLDNGVNASLSGEVANNIILDGTTHDFSVAQDVTATIAGTIGGTGETDATAGLTKIGAGALTLSGTVDLTSMTVSAGSLVFGADSVTTLNDFSNSGTVTFTAGATLTVNGELSTSTNIGGNLCGQSTGDDKVNGANNEYRAISFTAGDGFVKSGSGNLIIEVDSGKLSMSNSTVRGGTLQLITCGENYGNITLDGGSLSLAARNNTGTHTISKLILNQDGGVHTCVWNIKVAIQDLLLNGHTLSLTDQTSAQASVYTFGNGSAGTSAGTGTIDVCQDGKDGSRSVHVILNGENILSQATLNIAKETSASRSINIAYSNVKVGGLGSTASTTNVTTYLSSNSGGSVNSDSTVRTLTITGTGSTNTFNGTVKNNLNIVMGDTGEGAVATPANSKQIFSGNVDAFDGNITVNAGTLRFNGTLGNAKTVTINGGSLELANNASFATLAGTGGSLVNTATSGNALTLTLTGEGGTYAGSVSDFNIAMGGTATGTHAFTGELTDIGTISVENGTLQFSNNLGSVSSISLTGGALEFGSEGYEITSSLNMSSGSIVNSGTITVATGGTLTATGGTLENTSLTLNSGSTVSAGEGKSNTLSAAIINGDLTVNSSDTLTLASSAAMHLNDLTTSASIKLDTDVTVSGTIKLTGNGEINFGNEKMLIYNGYTFTNLDLLEDTDGNVGKLDVTYEGEGASQTKNVLAEGLRVMRTSTGASTLAYKMTDVKFVNGEGAGDTTLTATGNTFTDIIVAGGTLTIGADTGKTTVSGDVTMTSRSATLTVENGASLSNGVITLSGLNGSSLVINNGETNASVFYGGGTEYSAANITNATVGIASGITGDGDPYVWGAQLVNSTLTTSGNVELFNTAAHSLYELTISSDTLRLNGNLTVQSQGVGATTATDGDITLGAGAKLVMENNGVLTNTLTNGTVITIAGKDTDDIDYDSTITNTTANSVTLGALGAGLEIAYSIVTVNANGNTVNTAVTLDNSTLEVIGGTATASVATGSTNDFHALDGAMTVSVTTEGEQAAVANIGTLQVTGTGKTATFAKAGEANTYASINLQGDGSVIEAGNAVVAETVTVKGATAAEGENPAVPGATLKVTASASDMAHVGGNLTVEGGGTLAVAGATANMPAVQVDNLLTLKEGAVLNLKDVAVTGETATIAVAKANQVAGESAVLNTGDTISGLVVVTDASYHATNVYTGSAMARSTDTYVYADLEKNKITGYSIDGSGTLHLTTNISSGTDMSAYTDLSFVFETGVLAQLMNANLGDQVDVSLCYSGAGGTQGAVIDIQNGATVSFNGYAGANDAATNAVWTDNVGTYYVGENIPEPTTGTLGVLALAALAARRRRKK